MTGVQTCALPISTEIHDYNLKKDYLAKGERRGERKAFLASLQSLMFTTGWSVDQALAALNIPEDDWPM